MFYVSGTRKKMTSWHQWIGQFKFSRGKPSIHAFCFIIFICCINLQISKVVQWPTGVVVTLRTWVRSQVPTLSYYFYFNHYPMQVYYEGSPYTHKIQPSTCMPRSIQGLQFEGYHERESMHSHAGIRGQRHQELSGPELLGLYLHIGD